MTLLYHRGQGDQVEMDTWMDSVGRRFYVELYVGDRSIARTHIDEEALESVQEITPVIKEAAERLAKQSGINIDDLWSFMCSKHRGELNLLGMSLEELTLRYPSQPKLEKTSIDTYAATKAAELELEREVEKQGFWARLFHQLGKALIRSSKAPELGKLGEKQS
jgi:hypothetical protein